MTNDQVEKVDLKSLDIKEQNLERLKEIFPAAFTEGKVDFKKLEQLLGEDVEKGIERYNFTWPGKSNAIKEISAPSLGTLKPARDESVNFDDTENLFIEADNLEALKLLQKSYLGKIKMIYIDPPYNTGKDFVYKDNFGETLKDYLEFTQQKDEEGKVFTTNPDSAGRFHSNWLNMMYPRLYLARNLLTEDGVIFISINDCEITNLRRITDEVFGENNFVAQLVWSNKEGGGSSDSKYFRVKHEYILCYAKTIAKAQINGVDITNRERYNSSDEFVESRGQYYLQKLGMGSIQYSESLDYPITAPDSSLVMPKDNNSGKKACWRWSKKKYEWGLENGFVEIKKDSKGVWTVYTKQYLNCDNEGNLLERTQRPFGVIDNYSSTQASKFLDSIGFSGFFDYTKPSDLIKYLILLVTGKDDYILDFFAGSSTTAHATLALNQEDNGGRKFIMVQLPEPTDAKSEANKAGFMNIAEISKERIRRVIVGMNREVNNSDLDLGFKVFKLDKSSFKTWDGTDPENLDAQLQLGVDRVDPQATDEDILYEVMLKDGFMLTEKPEIKTIDGKKVYSFGDGFLLVCLEKKLTKEFIKQMAELMPKTEADTTVIFLDEGFHDNDQLLVNAVEIFKSRNEKINFRIV